MLVAEDLLAPKGRIEGKSFFPDLSLTDLVARVGEYLEQAYIRTASDGIPAGDVDDAARYLVYNRAFDAVYLSLLSNPLSSATPEGGTASFAIAQAEQFRQMASDALDDYSALVPVDGAPPVSLRASTVGVKTHFSW